MPLTAAKRAGRPQIRRWKPMSSRPVLPQKRLRDLIETGLDGHAAAASGLMIAITVALTQAMERLAGLSRFLR